MAIPTLDTIRIKVRKLTRSPSLQQLSNAELDAYINTFVLYDMPEHLRLFNLYKTFDFYTEPGIDVYKSSTIPNLFDFLNTKITIHPPIYIAGLKAVFSESREQFYNMYPNISSISQLFAPVAGNPAQFTGIINSAQSNIPSNLTQKAAFIRNNVLFNSIDANGNGLVMIDYPISATTGNLYTPGTAPTSTTIVDPINNINYITGAYTVTFVSPPGAGVTSNSQTVMTQTAMPRAMLFFDGYFTLRPVPDQVYKVTMDVYIQPTEFLQSTDQPELAEWWQYIAYGAAKKVFEDRMDLESVQQIMPEYKQQEMLIQRRTIVQMTSQRTATIYTQDNNQIGTYGGFGPWNSNF